MQDELRDAQDRLRKAGCETRLRVYLESLGCRLNAAEIETLAREFAGAGHEVVDTPDLADLIVLNSCAVTVQAARKSRHRLRALHRERPSADLAVTGCWATEDGERARRVEGVRWVVPNADKADAVTEIVGWASDPAPWAPGRWGHTRAFLGVQDGCDHACTYCVTRLLRGRARSRPLTETVAEVAALVTHRAKEVILTGVSLGSYGYDLAPEITLADLVEAILTDTDLPRLRLSSIEPWDVDERLLSLWAHPRLCRQLHLPLQSGSDAVLKRMGRRITTDAFEQLVHRAREVAPGLAITTDLIAGFPGETENDFARTLDYVEAIGFARLHVFRYSERAGTPAVRLPGRVDHRVRTERARRLRALGRKLGRAYRARFVGEVLTVLWEQEIQPQVWSGLTDNYIEIHAPTPAGDTPVSLHNQITPTQLVTLDKGFVIGRIVEPI